MRALLASLVPGPSEDVRLATFPATLRLKDVEANPCSRSLFVSNRLGRPFGIEGIPKQATALLDQSPSLAGRHAPGPDHRNPL